MLILSLFPGIGLLDRAFEAEGFCVVRGPDLIWGGDIHNFHPPAGRFDGIIGGPPCQAFSTGGRITGSKSANLIPEFERCIAETAPAWFLMENVKDAPLPAVPGYNVHSFLFNNRWLGEEQNRVRRFSFGSPGGHRLIIPGDLLALFENPVKEVCVLASDNYKAMLNRKNGKRYRTIPEMARLQGLPEDFDVPAFTRAELGKSIGNGVPLPMGRAVARAIKEVYRQERLG